VETDEGYTYNFPQSMDQLTGSCFLNLGLPRIESRWLTHVSGPSPGSCIFFRHLGDRCNLHAALIFYADERRRWRVALGSRYQAWILQESSHSSAKYPDQVGDEQINSVGYVRLLTCYQGEVKMKTKRFPLPGSEFPPCFTITCSDCFGHSLAINFFLLS